MSDNWSLMPNCISNCLWQGAKITQGGDALSIPLGHRESSLVVMGCDLGKMALKLSLHCPTLVILAMSPCLGLYLTLGFPILGSWSLSWRLPSCLSWLSHWNRSWSRGQPLLGEGLLYPVVLGGQLPELLGLCTNIVVIMPRIPDLGPDLDHYDHYDLH